MPAIAQPRIESALNQGSRINTSVGGLARGDGGGLARVAVCRGGGGDARTRCESRSDAQWPVGWPRPVRRTLGDLVQRRLNCSIQLRIRSVRVVLWRVVHLDVRVSAVVLDPPAHVVEEERELRLRGDGAVNQAMPRPDADHAAPGPLTYQRPQLHHLERVREDVAV